MLSTAGCAAVFAKAIWTSCLRLDREHQNPGTLQKERRSPKTPKKLEGSKTIEESKPKSPFTPDILKSMQACVDHANDLVDAARLLHGTGKPNIAYHLAALGLEETGRRELIAFQAILNATKSVPPTWPLRHAEDHVQKMFWAFFGGVFRTQKITKEIFEQTRLLAEHIHSRRLAGLYVNTTGGPNVPSDAIPAEESQSLIEIVEARLALASSEEHSPDLTQEDIDMQTWFLTATDDEAKRNLIFSDASMSKLAALGSAREWVEWLKAELDAANAQAMEVLKRELSKDPAAKSSASKPKWKMRLRIFADAHSVRPKALNWWNKGVTWIKLVPVPERRTS